MQIEILASLVLLLQLSRANTLVERQGSSEKSVGLESTIPTAQFPNNSGPRYPGEQILMQEAIRRDNIGFGASFGRRGSPIVARGPYGYNRNTPRMVRRSNLNPRMPKKKAAAAPAAAAKPATVPKESKKEAKAAAKAASAAVVKPAAPVKESKKAVKAAAKEAKAAAKAASPPKPSKKETKKINAAAKLLNSDAQKELKKQNTDEQHAVKNLQGIQNGATKATQKATAKNAKNEAKAEAGLQKDQAAYQKASTNPQGKKGAKAESKAEAALNKAKTGLTKTQQGATAAMQKINDGENKALDKNAANLDKGIKKAHSAQFNKDGVAKEHPTTWQKFKKVMGYIGTGILDIIPGTEEVGAAVTIARTAVTLGAKAAAKAAGKAAAKAGLKQAKEKGKDAAENALGGSNSVDPVTAAKTETDTQKAAAQANADDLKVKYQQAAANVQHPAASQKKKRDSSLADPSKAAKIERDAQRAAADTNADKIRAYYQIAAVNVQHPASQKARRNSPLGGEVYDVQAAVRTSRNIVVRDPASNKFFFLPPTWS